MKFFTNIFQGFKLDFKLLFIMIYNSKNAHFSMHLSMTASVSTCNNSHLNIQSPRKMLFILTVHSYSFLPFLSNFGHRLTELNVSLF